MKIVEKESKIGDADYPDQLLWSMILGPIFTAFAILFGIVWLLAVIPHRLLFGKEEK